MNTQKNLVYETCDDETLANDILYTPLEDLTTNSEPLRRAAWKHILELNSDSDLEAQKKSDEYFDRFFGQSSPTHSSSSESYCSSYSDYSETDLAPREPTPDELDEADARALWAFEGLRGPPIKSWRNALFELEHAAEDGWERITPARFYYLAGRLYNERPPLEKMEYIDTNSESESESELEWFQELQRDFNDEVIRQLEIAMLDSISRLQEAEVKKLVNLLAINVPLPTFETLIVASPLKGLENPFGVIDFTETPIAAVESTTPQAKGTENSTANFKGFMNQVLSLKLPGKELKQNDPRQCKKCDNSLAQWRQSLMMLFMFLFATIIVSVWVVFGGAVVVLWLDFVL